MDHNYNDNPILTSSDYECIMEDLKPLTASFSDLGSPFHMVQNTNYEDPMMRPVMPQVITSSPPPLQEFGPVAVPHLVTSPPELSPSSCPDGTIPSRDEYPGQLEFELLLDSATSSKQSWLYSHVLKKVFIDVKKSLLIRFHVNNFFNGLFVRALPVFEQDDFVSVPVERCGLHAISDDPHFRAHPSDQPGVCYCARHKMAKHIVLCGHPQARYDYNAESNRHSVVVPLDAPHPGSDTTTVEYQFLCKTSCPQGMNRKPIVVIFTLENEQREVLGRFVLPVKICSCPKRDKEKEEKEKEEKEKDQNGNTPQGKRRLSSSHEKPESKKVKSEINRQNESGCNETTKTLGQVVHGLHELETKMNHKFHELETTMNQKFIELEQRLDQKLNKIKEDILSAMYLAGKPNLFQFKRVN